jgi:hypothetical protein
MANRERKSFPILSLVMIPLALFFLIWRDPTTLGKVISVLMLISGIAGILAWWASGHVATDPADAAADILKTQKALYSGLHEFRAANPREFKGADLDFYAKSQKVLERNGFRFLGDVEDVTATAEFPQMRSFLRVFSGDGGAVMAAVYHVNMKGMYRMLQRVGVLPKHLKMVDLETELSDGTFIVTCNSKGADTTGAVPRIARFQYSIESTPEELLKLHREQLQQAMIREPLLTPVPARTLEEVLAAQNRLQEIKNAHKKGIGYMDAKELQNISGGEWTPEMQEVADEIERRKRQ